MNVDKNLERIMDLAIEMKSLTSFLTSDKTTIHPEDEGLKIRIGEIDSDLCNLMLDIGEAIGESVFWVSVDVANDKGKNIA